MVGRLGSVGVRQVPFAQFLWWDLVQWAGHIAAAENPRVGSRRWSVAAKTEVSMGNSCTLWWTNSLQWKDPPFLMGKSTISTGSFSIAMLVHQRVTAVMIKSGATSLERACDLFKHLLPCNWRGWTWSWQKLRWRLPEQAVSGTVPVIQVFQVPTIYTGLFPAETIIDISPCRVNILYNINMNFGFCFLIVPLRT